LDSFCVLIKVQSW